MKRLIVSALMVACVGHVSCCQRKEPEPLLLTPTLEAGNVSQIRNASAVDFSPYYAGASYSGYLTANETLGNHLFFWFFPSPNDQAPLMVWLNGGPGLSSLIGLFFENGPMDLRSDWSWKPWDRWNAYVVPRKSSWVGPFSMLYIDSPVGTGFSFSTQKSLRRDREGYTSDLYNVLTQFYQIFPEYTQRELYIGGQSYAGKYVPALASRIHRNNQMEGKTRLPLAGVYLGGPFFAPEEIAISANEFIYNLGYISKSTAYMYNNYISNIFTYFRRNSEYIGSIFPMLDYNFDEYKFDSPYINKDETYYAHLARFINDPDRRKLIHAGNQNAKIVSNKVHDSMRQDFLVDTKDEMKTVLDNYKTLVYNGDSDVIVNTLGIERGLEAVGWEGRDDYANAARSVWKSDNKVKGFFSHVRNLCRVVVRGAGHWTPRDKPQSTREMMEAFVKQGCL